MIDDIQIIKDIFQSFEEDHNYLSSEYVVMTPDRRVLQYVEIDGLKDGLANITPMEFRNYFNGRVDRNIFKVKINIPVSNLESIIDDSLNYLDRIESEGFYCNLRNSLIISRNRYDAVPRRSITYYDIAIKSDEYVGFMNDRGVSGLYFYFYFSRV